MELKNTTHSRRHSLVRRAGIVPFVAGGILVLTGCGQQPATSEAESSNHTAQSASDAPVGSTAKESEEKTGVAKTAPMDAATYTTKLDFSSQPARIPVGKPVTWMLKVSDAKSGQPVKSFETEMTKKMHLIVVKNDLSWFNHIHPTLGADGTFTVTTTLPTSGSYKLYADYTPTGRKQEVPQHEFATGGAQPAPSSVSLVPDKMQDMWLTKKFVAHPEGEPNAKGGATYEVAMMPMPAPLVAGQASMLHFQIRDASGKPLRDLQPYLGTLGHCVILSQDTTKYLHSHPMAAGMEHDMSKMGDMDMSKMNEAPVPKSGGPDVMFHTNFPKAGLYKAWGQFKHKGQIITASFVVNVGAAKGGASEQTNQDESKPHSH